MSSHHSASEPESFEGQPRLRSAETVSIGGKEYISGLYWQVLNNRRAYKAEAAVIGKRDQMELRALHLGAVMQAGFASRSMGAEKGMISLALAVMAGLGESFFAIFELADGRFALIAASDGALIPGCDFIGPRDEVEHRATQKLALFSDITKVIAPSDFQISGSTAMEIGPVLAKARIRHESKLASVSFEASSRSVVGLVAVCGLFCAAIFGWIAWSRYEDGVHAAESKRDALTAKAAIETAEERAQLKAYQKYLEHPWKSLPLAADFMHACQSQVDRMPISIGGWIFSSATCEGSAVTSIYDRSTGGTMNSMIESSMKLLHMAPQFDKSNETAMLKTTLALKPGGDEAVSPLAEVIPTFVSHWQTLGMPIKFAEVPVKMPDPKTLPGQKSSKLPPPKPDWHEFDWSLSSDTNPIDLLSDVARPGLRVKRMAASLNSKQAVLTWKTEGFLYVH